MSGASSSGGDLDGGGDPNVAGSSATSPGESRRLSIQRCIQSLLHACQCRDANCRRPSCIKMKRVVQHSKSCKRKNNQTDGPPCPICKQLVALCCYHSKHCEQDKCPVPYCLNIKNKFKTQQMQLRLKQAQLVKRRIASMASMSSTSSSQNNQSSNSSSTPFSPQHVSTLTILLIN